MRKLYSFYILYVVLVLSMFSFTSPLLASCIAPINQSGDGEDYYNLNWLDVRNAVTSKDLNSLIKQVQTIDSTGAYDYINYDYYELTIDAPSNFENFIHEFKSLLVASIFNKPMQSSVYSFLPYDLENKDKWDSKEPLGAVVTSVMSQFVNPRQFDQASEVVSCSADDSFLLSTIYTAKDGFHPLSGNRGFGVKKNSDNSLTIYTKSAYRVTGAAYKFMIADAQVEHIFNQSNTIWKTVFDNLASQYANLNPRNQITRHEKIKFTPKPLTDEELNEDEKIKLPLDFKNPLYEKAFRNGVREYESLVNFYGSDISPEQAKKILVHNTKPEVFNSGNPIQIDVRVFLPPPVVRDVILGGFAFGGDNRGPEPIKGTSRLDFRMYLNPLTGHSLSSAKWGKSTEYFPSSVVSVPGKPIWWWDVVPGALPSRSKTLEISRDNVNSQSAAIYGGVIAKINYHGGIPLVTPSPKIDGELEIKYLHDGSMYLKIKHDGFPQHTVYINGQLVYNYDPIVENSNPSALAGNGEIERNQKITLFQPKKYSLVENTFKIENIINKSDNSSQQVFLESLFEGELEAYFSGIYFASLYNHKYNQLAWNNQSNLGLGLNSIVESDIYGWIGGKQLEEEGITLSKIRESIPDALTIEDNIAQSLPANISVLNTTVIDTLSKLNILKNMTKDSAYLLVNAKIDELRNKLETEAQNTIIDYIAKELDLSENGAEQVRALQQFYSDSQAVKGSELSTLKLLNMIFYKYLSITGNCLCFPPAKCSNVEMVCTGYFIYNKTINWKPTWNNLAQWAIETTAEAYGFSEVTYMQELAKYADAVKKATELYQKFEQARVGVNAAKALNENFNKIMKIDFIKSVDKTMNAYTSSIKKATIEDPLGLPAKFCPIDSLTTDNCSLLLATQEFNALSNEIHNNLETMNNSFQNVEGFNDVIAYFTDVSLQLSSSLSPKVVYLVESLYEQLETLYSTVRQGKNIINVADQFASDIQAGNLSLSEITKKADLLSSMQQVAFNAAIDETDTLIKQLNEKSLISSILNKTSSLMKNFQLFAKEASLEKNALKSNNFNALTLDIAELYPEQNVKTILERYNESKSAFLFFRQFPPYFYTKVIRMANNEEKFKPLKETINKIRSWTTGDPHLQNFGTFLPMNAQTSAALQGVGPKDDDMNPNSCSANITLNSDPRIVMNDPDDGGEGSVLLDLTRYLVGLGIFNKEVIDEKSADLITAYLNGILGIPINYSDSSKRLIEASQGSIINCRLTSGKTMKSSYLDGNKFAKLRDDVREPQILSPTDITAALAIVREVFSPNAVITDSYKYQRFMGGSGGNWRWELLVNNGGSSKTGNLPVSPAPYWIEFKGLALRPGNYPASIISYPKEKIKLNQLAKNRYRETLSITHDKPDAMASYRVVDTPDGPAMVRYRYAGQSSYNISGISKNNLVDVAKDQLHILGEMHRKALLVNDQDSENIINSYVEMITAHQEALLQFVEELRSELNEDYNIIKVNDEEKAKKLENLPNRSPLAELELKQLKKIINERNISDAGSEEENIKDENPIFVIQELNVLPSKPDCQEQSKGFKAEDFQYISLINVSDHDQSTKGLTFTNGIKYDFPSDITIAKNKIVVIAKNPRAVEDRYEFPSETIILGPFNEGTELKTDGEKLKLVRQISIEQKEEIFEFVYEKNWFASELYSDVLFNKDISRDTDVLSVSNNWIRYRKRTKTPSYHQLIPELVMYHASTPQDGKHDFVLLANTSDQPLDLNGLIISGGIHVSLEGILAPGERIALASSKSHFSARYPTLAQKVLEYSGKLSNDADEIKLSCPASDTKSIWSIEYVGSDWPMSVNGGGSALAPVERCGVVFRLKDYWRVYDPLQNQLPDEVCKSAQPVKIECAEGYIHAYSDALCVHK